MPSVFDVAQYILDRCGPMTTMKLQKLVYYSQAWSVVWDDDFLFPEPIQAWRNGPVVPELWNETRGHFRIKSVLNGNASKLSAGRCETVDKVVEFYGDRDAQWLSDLTHLEDPWREAYEQGQNTEISLERMSEYYSTIEPDVPTNAA
jgi:uncharacterized phage-associated protein